MPNQDLLKTIQRVLAEDAETTPSPTSVKPDNGTDTGPAVVSADAPAGPNSAKNVSKMPVPTAHPSDAKGGNPPTNSDLAYPQLQMEDNKDDADEKNPTFKLNEGDVPNFLKKGGDDDDKGDDKGGDDKKGKNPFAKKDDKDKDDDDDKGGKKIDIEIKESDDDKKKDEDELAEGINNLFDGANLSEDFRAKATTIFRAVVAEGVKKGVSKLEEKYTEKLNHRVDTIREALSTKCDNYLTFVAEAWMKKNELAVQNSLRADLVEGFIVGLKNLFEENYVELPAGKMNVLEAMARKVQNLEQKLNEQVEINVQLSESANRHQRSDVINSLSKGLTNTQVEKLNSIAENLEFKSVKQFTDAVTTLRESFLGTSKPAPKKTTLIAEATLGSEPVAVSPGDTADMRAFLDALSRGSEK